MTHDMAMLSSSHSVMPRSCGVNSPKTWASITGNILSFILHGKQHHKVHLALFQWRQCQGSSTGTVRCMVVYTLFQDENLPIHLLKAKTLATVEIVTNYKDVNDS